MNSFIVCLFLLLANFSIGQRQQLNGNAMTENISIYRKFISAGIGANCGMFPSCSEYSMQCFMHKPLAMGFIKTGDRLLRCGNDLGNYEKIKVNGKYFAFDPTSRSTIVNSRVISYPWLDSICNSDSLRFIRYLLEEGRYKLASDEIVKMRFSNSLSRNNLNEEVFFILELVCLVNLGDFETCIDRSRRYLIERQNPLVTELLADSYFYTSNFYLSRQLYSVLIAENRIESVKNLSRKKIASQCFLNEWGSAISEFDSQNEDSKELRELMVRGANVKLKSPIKAKVFAIIPGMGYLYSGSPKTALASFLFNGLTAFAAYDLLKRQQIGMGVLMTAMSFSFYLGNIYGSGRAANSFNELRTKTIKSAIANWAY